MAQATSTLNVQIAGLSLNSSVQRTADHQVGFDPTLAVAKSGTLTTRTDDDTGALTMDDAGHGITTASIIDLYWDGGARYDIVVGTVSGTSVPFGALGEGTGDVLPAQDTEITAMVQQTITGAIDGDAVKLAAIKAEYTTLSGTGKARVGFFDAADDLIASIELDANATQQFDIVGGQSNPFTGDPITYMKASHSDTVNTCQIKIGALVDSTP